MFIDECLVICEICVGGMAYQILLATYNTHMLVILFYDCK